MRKGLLLCALLSALVGCENLSDTLTDDLTTTFTFYDENEAELVACPYQIGTVLPADSLPTKFPPKKGYLVGGWRFYQKETNAAYDVPTNVTNDKEGIVTSVTVTSVPLSFQVVWWKPITYTIVFDGNGGHLADDKSISTHSEDYSYSDGGPTLWKNAFERNGYDFNGWNVAENRDEARHDYTDGETLDYHLADEEGAEVMLYACWLKKEITITFGAGEGSGEMETATLKVGDPLPACGFTAPEGKQFAGWQWADRSFADEETLTEDNYPNENAAFVAQWDWKTVAVTFDPNGGDGGSDTQEFKWGQPQSLPESNRHGYDFVGWNTNQDGSGTAYANGDSFRQDTTLYAQWRAQAVLITFDPNGGAGTMVAQSISFADLPQWLSKNTCTRTGWNFVGWKMGADSAAFGDEALITAADWDTLYASGGAITLSAEWKSRCDVSWSSEELDCMPTAEGFTFTAPSGSAYQWMRRSGNGTVTPLGNGQTYTIAYADYEHDPAEYTLVVIVFDVNGTPEQYWAEFHVNPQAVP